MRKDIVQWKYQDEYFEMPEPVKILGGIFCNGKTTENIRRNIFQVPALTDLERTRNWRRRLSEEKAAEVIE